MSLTAPERETIITLNDEDDTALVWTAQRPIITKLKKNSAAELLEQGTFEGSVWASFQLPKDMISFRSRRQTLTPEQKKARAEQLRAARTVRSPRSETVTGLSVSETGADKTPSA